MDTNRKAILASAAVTAFSTGALFSLPVVIPLTEVKLFLYETTGMVSFGNPFTQLRLLGGIPGGFIGGYFARDHFGDATWAASMKVGTYGVLLALLFIWVVFVLYNLARATIVYGVFPPPIYDIVVLPILLALPLVPTYLIEGIVFGVVGNGVNSFYGSI
jgi:hypothetical protein